MYVSSVLFWYASGYGMALFWVQLYSQQACFVLLGTLITAIIYYRHMLFIYCLDIQTSVDGQKRGQTRALDKDKLEQNSHKQGVSASIYLV